MYAITPKPTTHGRILSLAQAAIPVVASLVVVTLAATSGVVPQLPPINDIHGMALWAAFYSVVVAVSLYVPMAVMSVTIVSGRGIGQAFSVVCKPKDFLDALLLVTSHVVAALVSFLLLFIAMSRGVANARGDHAFISDGQMDAWAVLVAVIVPSVCVAGVRLGLSTYAWNEATTSQQKYERHVQELEIAASGQLWDKLMLRLSRMKPAYGIVPVIVAAGVSAGASLLIVVFIVAAVAKSHFSLAFVAACAVSIIGVFVGCAWLKWRDGKRSEPRFVAVTTLWDDGEHNGEIFDPQIVGLRKFDRS